MGQKKYLLVVRPTMLKAMGEREESYGHTTKREISQYFHAILAKNAGPAHLPAAVGRHA